MNNSRINKIGYLYQGNPTETKYWSGTVSSLHKIISKIDGIELVDIVVEPNPLSKYLYKIVRLFSGKKNQFSLSMSFLDSAKANRLIRNSGCDIIFAPACSRLIHAGRKALKDKKLIYLSDATYHNMIGYYFNHSEHDQKIGNLWEKTSHELASAVILPAKWSCPDAINYYGTPKEKLNILKFGANIEDCGYKVVNPHKDVYKLLLVGVNYVRKGVDIAIKAVELLNQTSSNIRYELNIVGLNKPDFDIPDCVTFHGKLRKSNEAEFKKLIEFYKDADIFILPTQAECSAIVFSEAQMFGLPVFTYDTGGTTDYVEDGVSGRCLNPSCGPKDFCEAISSAINDGSIEKYSVHSREKYENELNWGHWQEQFESIIKKLS